jgi:hypothetical protein
MKKLIQVLIVCGLFVVMGETASGENQNKNLESFIKTVYMAKDKVYGFKPKGKLSVLGEIKSISLFDGPLEQYKYVAYRDGIFPISDSKLISNKYSQNIDDNKYPFMKPILSYINNPYKFFLSKKIVISNGCSISDRALIFYGLNYHDKNSSKFDTEDQYGSWGKSSFLFLNKETVLDPKHRIERMGGESGGPSRSLWDIFKHAGKEYILIHAQYYEGDKFEVYQINEYNLELKVSSWIGGL